MEIRSNPLKRLLTNAFGLNLAPNNLLEAPATDKETEDEKKLVHIDEAVKIRAGMRLLAEEINKQNNIEEVVQRADKILESEPRILESQDITEPDWVDECLDGAGKAYNDNLKDYWAKLLAGEIQKPGTYSKRTIAFMKSLSQKDAERVRNMCQYVMYSEKHDASILRYDEEIYSFDEIRFLMELRLLDAQSFIVKEYKFKNGNGNLGFYHGDVGFIIKVKKPNYNLPIYAFTELGMEVLSIVDDTPMNIDSLKHFSEYMIKNNKPMEFLCGKLVTVNGKPAININEPIFELPERVKQEGTK